MFYIYILLDPRKKGKYSFDTINTSFLYEPIYVGKGQYDRWNDHLREATNTNHNSLKLNKIRKIIRETNSAPIILILYKFKDESQAFLKEIDLISKIGRIDLRTGFLTNLTNGGEGQSGAIVTDETRKKISDALSNGKSPRLGKKHKQESIEKMRKAQSGENHHMFGKRGPETVNYGKKFSDEWVDKIRKSKLGENNYWFNKTLSEEHKSKISKSNSKKNHPNYGKHLTQEHKNKISQKLKGRVFNEQWKQNIKNAKKRKKELVQVV